jgi:type IV secretory pathway VirB6-like protein
MGSRYDRQNGCIFGCSGLFAVFMALVAIVLGILPAFMPSEKTFASKIPVLAGGFLLNLTLAGLLLYLAYKLYLRIR